MKNLRSLQLTDHRRRILVGLVVAVLALFGFTDFLAPDALDREEVEKAAKTTLIHSGVNATDVSCPGELEWSKGATIECTYIDLLSEVAGVIVGSENAPPPKKGRFELRIDSFDGRMIGRRFVRSSANYEVRVIDSAR